MFEARTLETQSPKELGKHLRDLRRRKGLSLSEVARGAGLTRRELNAYEKGKIPIPDHDLFVLAGSCGVDVAELRVPTTAAELGAAHEVGNALVPADGPTPAASPIGDVAAQLRHTEEVTGPAEPVDVFEELARLPDPAPLPAGDTVGDSDTAAAGEPVPVEMRRASVTSPWDALRGSEARSTPDGAESLFGSDDDRSYSKAVHDTDFWEPATVSANANAQWFDEVSSVATPDTDPSAFDMAPHASVSHIFDPRFGGDDDAVCVVASVWELPAAVPESTPHLETAYESEVEPETAAATIAEIAGLRAVGTEAGSGTHPVHQARYEHDVVEDEAVSEPEHEGAQVFEVFGPIVAEPLEAVDPAEPFEIDEPCEREFRIPGDDEPPLISWHPDLDHALTTPIESFAPVAEPEADPESEPERRESFVVAGAGWVLGNAVPHVEVRSTGSLVMRRADERWALADVITSTNFAVEVDVDLRSGPGFGVLFCADLDDEGRMSGYSFDVDPVYEGGGYLVREWRANREMWSPLGHAAAPELADRHGRLEVRLTVDDDTFVATVDGDVVLTIDSLQQASIDRGRAAASGNLVGVQASSPTDLVIDELRVAAR